MRVNTIDQPALFDVDTPPVRTPARKATGTGKPKWTPYQTQRGQRCDDCYAVIFEAKGEGPASRRARWRRVQGDSDLLLCYAHGRARRVADGLEEAGE